MVEPLIVHAGSAKFAFVDPPGALYKFFSDEAHAQALVERGEVRIGTLYDFRAIEGWDSVRGDAGEGEFTITLESSQPETITVENAPWYLKDKIAELGLPIFSHGGTINAAGNYPNTYVFCASAVQTSALAAYGRYCVRIHDIIGFFTALTRHLTDEIGIAAKAPFDPRDLVSSSGESIMAHSYVPRSGSILLTSPVASVRVRVPPNQRLRLGARVD